MNENKVVHTAYLLFVLVAFVMSSGCASTQRTAPKADSEARLNTERMTFEQASNINTAKAYRQFLDRHPNSELAVQARSKLLAIEMQESEEWEDAQTTDTFHSYVRFHRAHREARSDGLHDRLLKLVNLSGVITGRDLADHVTYLKAANAVEFHNLRILFSNASRLTIIGGGVWPYPYGGTISTTATLASMLFGDQVMYVFISETDSSLAFKVDAIGLHHVSGTGNVVAVVGTTVNVYAYK